MPDTLAQQLRARADWLQSDSKVAAKIRRMHSTLDGTLEREAEEEIVRLEHQHGLAVHALVHLHQAIVGRVGVVGVVGESIAYCMGVLASDTPNELIASHETWREWAKLAWPRLEAAIAACGPIGQCPLMPVMPLAAQELDPIGERAIDPEPMS